LATRDRAADQGEQQIERARAEQGGLAIDKQPPGGGSSSKRPNS
jgi:hypothetical protein